MNYNKINELALLYKTDKNIISEIINQYKPLLNKFLTHTPVYDHDEIRSIFNYQLVLALEAYDSSKSGFNTFCYYYLLAIPRLYHSSNTYFNNKLIKTPINLYEEAEDLEPLLMLDLDILNILSPEERLLYRSYVTGKIKRWSPQLEGLLSKLLSYIRE